VKAVKRALKAVTRLRMAGGEMMKVGCIMLVDVAYYCRIYFDMVYIYNSYDELELVFNSI
jgi:hypothetical protein